MTSQFRRNSHVAMSVEMRAPRELLARIGLSGKEVVKIIKSRGWDIVEPHGLQQQNLYYIPGVIPKTTQGYEPVQNKEYFVGEGELYAFILREGGLRYLLPDEELSGDSGVEISRFNEIIETSVEADDESDVINQKLRLESSDQRKWKRRKNLSTARSTSVDNVTNTSVHLRKRQKIEEKSNTSEHNDDEEGEETTNQTRVSRRITLEQAKHATTGQQSEFIAYQNSLKARGWRAQLLQDIDVHLLRATAAVSRNRRTRKRCTDKKKNSTRLIEEIGPHVVDAAEMLQEINELINSMRASQDDLSSIIEAMISNGEQRTIPDRIDVVGRIGIPGFVSTGRDNLVLMRDIERYLLVVVAAVRRYQRTRKAFCASDSTIWSSLPPNRAVKREELRALQLSIEESKRELHELAAMVAADATMSCQDAAQDSTVEDTTRNTSCSVFQSTLQGSPQSTSKTTDCDAEVDTEHNKHLVSPRLEGGLWFV
ncbi:unnamed protein product [Peronospora destructor]|uniref:Uncharacterized protein n=1 Tax=Peronospora destructor TaxID=86335 RepID=A0AAV0UXH6_9STRA|nr:unnamed protein product [Peronospora destructor]